MKKKILTLIGIVLIVALFVHIPKHTSKDAAEDFAISFIEECFSDGAEDYANYLDMISKDSSFLQDFTRYKKEIKINSGVKDLYLSNFKVEEVKVKILSRDAYDVFVITMEENKSIENPTYEQTRQNFYRVIVERDSDKLKAVKAISDDFTSSTFFPELMSNKEAFLNYDMANSDQDIQEINIAKEVERTKLSAAEVERAKADYAKNKDEIDLRNK